jgi:hypothetical protein
MEHKNKFHIFQAMTSEGGVYSIWNPTDKKLDGTDKKSNWKSTPHHLVHSLS